MNWETRLIGRGSPLYSFLPARWGRGVREATVATLESRSEDAAKELTKDIILLVPEALS